jgi:ABC-type nitrate/sulfonate/bicarbonate transport system substrate-binding protein
MSGAQLRIGTFTKSLLIEIARSTGKFKTAGLDVRESTVISSPAQFQSLETGELDLVITSPDNVLAYRFLKENPLGRNLPVRVLAAIDRGLGLSLCLAPEAANVEALRGRTLAVDVPKSGFAFVAYGLLDQAGLHPGDYEVVSLGATPLRAAALIADRCVATVLNAGNELRAEGAGCRIISRVASLGPYLGTVLAALDIGEGDRDDLHLRFADVLLETSNEINSGVLESMVIESSMSLLDLSEAEARVHYAVLRDPAQGLVLDGIVDHESIATLVELRQKYLPSAELSSIAGSLSDLVIARALADAPGPIND